MKLPQHKVQAHCNPRSCGCKELSRQRKRTEKKESQRTTKAIRNAGKVLNMNIVAINNMCGKLKNNRFKIPHYA